MKNFIKNIVLLVIALLLSYFSAQCFGTLYDYFVPQYNNSFLGTGRDLSLYIAGLPFAYVFFLTLIFRLFGDRNKNKWVLFLLIPPILLWIFADFSHIYLPIILGLVSFGLAKFIRFIIFKLKRPNPPMVIK